MFLAFHPIKLCMKTYLSIVSFLLFTMTVNADFSGFGGDLSASQPTNNQNPHAVAIGSTSYEATMPARFNSVTKQWECQSILYAPVSTDGFNFTCVLGNGEKNAVVVGPRGNTAVVGDKCGEALNKTKSQCRGAELSQYAPLALSLVGAMESAKANGNMKKACESAQQIYQMSGISNAAVAGMCQRAVSRCKKSCTDDEAGILQCEDYETYAKAATGQAIQSATAMIGSQACADAVAGKCQGDAAFNDEECTQFCLKPGRQDHPKCKIAMNNCSNPDYASQNLQYCTCVNNPFSPNCTTIGGPASPNSPVPGGVPGPGSLDFNDDAFARDYDYGGNGDQQGSAARVNAQQGGGGGGGLDGGGGSFAFGSNEGTGSNQEPLDKDILYGTRGGSGGGIVGGAGGGYGNGSFGGGGARGGSGNTKDSGIDLKAFLPGGKKDPTRNPASAGYADPTITKANGLTNWQKVTRKMNEKRPELMP